MVLVEDDDLFTQAQSQRPVCRTDLVRLFCDSLELEDRPEKCCCGGSVAYAQGDGGKGEVRVRRSFPINHL
jgi:hypothetical protein